MPPRRDLDAIVNGPDLSPTEINEALDGWARADGGRVVRAVAHLLTASRIAETWPDFCQHLDLDVYTDRDDPEPQPYTIAKIRNWSCIHNAIPVREVGKAPFSLFVLARALGDRGFVVCLSDLLEGMEPVTQRIASEAMSLRFGQQPAAPWARHREG